MTASPETLRTDEQAGIPLGSGEAYSFAPILQYGDQPSVAAEIYADSDGLNAEGGDAPDKLVLLDMRTVPETQDGWRQLGDARVTAHASYLLIDPHTFDAQRGVGYKALRPGETFLFGRPSADLPASDKRHRFVGLNGSTSRSHFEVSISEDERVSITDVGSTNGTNVMVEAPTREIAGRSHGVPVRKLGRLALGERAVGSKEFNVGDFHFELMGKVPDHRYGDLYALSSRDMQGRQRRFMVYRSQSEGGLRASQGIEYDGHFMKGSQHLEFTQYTQDTQLHPDFSAAFQKLLQEEGAGSSVDVLGEDVITLDHEAVHEANVDFEGQTESYVFPDRTVAALLEKSRAGNLGTIDVELDFGDVRGLSAYVSQLNAAIVKSGMLPDFSQQPQSTHYGEHPLLGHITTEVYAKDGVEWHMASDKRGRVWIDRIRMQDAMPTAYGTDKQMINSGILTSKPLDYKDQTSGLPVDLRSSFNERYDDITPFLAQLAPVSQYRSARQSIRAAAKR